MLRRAATRLDIKGDAQAELAEYHLRKGREENDQVDTRAETTPKTSRERRIGLRRQNHS